MKFCKKLVEKGCRQNDKYNMALEKWLKMKWQYTKNLQPNFMMWLDIPGEGKMTVDAMTIGEMSADQNEMLQKHIWLFFNEKCHYMNRNVE